MKTLFTVLLLLRAFNFANGQSILRLTNNTDKEVHFAYVYRDNDNNCWTSQGWYVIAAYQQTEINFGDYTNSVYIYGYQSILFGIVAGSCLGTWQLCVHRSGP